MLQPQNIVTLGRYVLLAELATGGMATVYLGRLQGPVGFSRIVAVKRMHPHFARDSDFALMFIDEARLAARIQHPNVVSTLDVVAQDGELFIVMDYVRGDSLAGLLRENRQRLQAPLPIITGIMIGALSGLHAAHVATSDDGAPLHIVHRDVSPQNILVGVDGLPRLVDFGVAKAAVRSASTSGREVKGKLCYMSPEQLRGGRVDRRTDIFAAAAVLWEGLTGRRLFTGDDTGAVVAQVLAGQVPPLGEFRSDIPPSFEYVLRAALSVDPNARYATAQQFADALEAAAPKVASARVIGQWVCDRASDTLTRREELVSTIESSARGHLPAMSMPPGDPRYAVSPSAPYGTVAAGPASGTGSSSGVGGVGATSGVSGVGPTSGVSGVGATSGVSGVGATSGVSGVGRVPGAMLGNAPLIPPDAASRLPRRVLLGAAGAIATLLAVGGAAIVLMSKSSVAEPSPAEAAADAGSVGDAPGSPVRPAEDEATDGSAAPSATDGTAGGSVGAADAATARSGAPEPTTESPAAKATASARSPGPSARPRPQDSYLPDLP